MKDNEQRLIDVMVTHYNGGGHIGEGSMVFPLHGNRAVDIATGLPGYHYAYQVGQAVHNPDAAPFQQVRNVENLSPKIFIDGFPYTRDEIAQQFPHQEQLLAEMDERGEDKRIRTRVGTWVSYEDSAFYINTRRINAKKGTTVDTSNKI